MAIILQTVLSSECSFLKTAVASPQVVSKCFLVSSMFAGTQKAQVG